MRTRRTLRSKRNVRSPSPNPSDTSLESGKRKQSKLKKVDWSEQMLEPDYVPEELVGRINEKQVIYKFVRDAVMNRMNSKVLYISGVPGVGKTASTREILGHLEKELRNRAKFDFINAMTLRKPEDIYRTIYQSILKVVHRGRQPNFPAKIEELLPNLQKTHIFVIDEVDFLLTNNQEIFYNLFEWTSSTTTRLALIIIANTMDFPEKLAAKINSRMGSNRLIFKPYVQTEIRDVIQDRLVNCPLFTSNAITYASKKLSTFSSDIRTILEVLRRAVAENKDENNQKRQMIGIETIVRIWQEKVGKRSEVSGAVCPLYTRIIDYMQAHGSCCISTDLHAVLRQFGVTHHNMMALLKEMTEMKLIKMKEAVRSGFFCHMLQLNIPS